MGSLRFPMRRNAQDSLWLGNLLAYLRPSAAELVVLNRVHRAAMPNEQGGHSIRQAGKLRGFGVGLRVIRGVVCSHQWPFLSMLGMGRAFRHHKRAILAIQYPQFGGIRLWITV